MRLATLQAAAAKCLADCNDYACVRMDACTGHHGSALRKALAEEVPCERCKGTGLTTRYNYDGNGSDADDQPCPHCALDREVALGAFASPDDKCRYCGTSVPDASDCEPPADYCSHDAGFSKSRSGSPE